MDNPEEDTPEGRIIRYDAPAGDPGLSFGDPGLIDEITNHLEAFLGPVNLVWHEIVSEYAHIDVHHFPPTPERNFHVLATTGMSERPMTLPDGMPDDWRFAELLLNLPSSWQLSKDAFADERYYWPMRLIKTVARFPHMYSTWLGYAHTLPNGDPPEPYDASTELCGAMLVQSMSLPEAINTLERANGQVIRFWTVLPLHADEMDLKVREGAEALFPLLDKAGISDVIVPERPSVVEATGRTVPRQRAHGATTDFASAWKERQRRKRLALWVPIASLPALFGLSRIPGFPSWAFGLLMIAWVVTFLVLRFRAGRWRCPRCGEVFQISGKVSNPFTRSCLNCGLPLNAAGTDPDERRPR